MKATLIILLSMLFAGVINSQELSQIELEKLNDENLLELFNENRTSNKYANRIASTYLIRAKLEMDSVKIARAYDRLGRLFDPVTNLKYADSIISISEHLNDVTFPCLGYLQKAFNFELLGQIDKALTNYITANELAYSRDNISLILYTNNKLIYYKSYWGNATDALPILKKQRDLTSSPDFVEKLKKSSRPDVNLDFQNYANRFRLSSLLNEIVIYVESGHLVKAQSTLEFAKQKLHTYEGGEFDVSFLEAECEIAFHLKNYSKVDKLIENIISLKKSRKGQEIYPLTPNLLYFQGMSYLNQGSQEKSIHSFILADSLYQNSPNLLFPRHRRLYLELIKYYDSQGDQNSQMKYLTRLIKWDSIFSENYRHVDSEIIKGFETPRLIAQKEALIAQLEDEKSLLTKKSTWILVLLLISLASLPYFIMRQRKLKKRFDALVKAQDSSVKKIAKPTTKSPLSSEVIDDIMNKLERFEVQQKFLNGGVSLQSVAKQFNTNSSYLSKVVNLYKDKNFSQYLNDLRIDYAVKELTGNSKFRRYTIKAIAQDVGFGNSQSFSKAFHSKTGLQPSYFIRKLNKQAS